MLLLATLVLWGETSDVASTKIVDVVTQERCLQVRKSQTQGQHKVRSS